MKYDFDLVGLGDTVTDAFILLEDASVHCNIDNEDCTISMRWGDKIPYKDLVVVHGVGNSANATVAATRLGLKSALVTDIGKDQFGAEILSNFKKEGLSTKFIRSHRDIPTNYHFVLSFEAERTILVKHQMYPHHLPKGLEKTRGLYLSSLGSDTEVYHQEIAEFVDAHPEMFVAFQPGTFQIKLGIEKLARIYKNTNLFFANKEEYQRILNLPEEKEVSVLLKKMSEHGPKTPILTDGRNGAYALNAGEIIHVPMFPDPAPPVERTGAGDAFSSTTAAYVLQGMPLYDAMVRGTINSAYVVQKIGAQAGLLTKKELESKLI
ncbi:MAG: carbohydrate kinase family protein [Patescibacteria group bacterium]